MDRTINIKIPCMNDLFRHNGKWSSQVSFVFDAAAFLLLVCGWTESRLAAGLVPGSVQKSLTILQEKEIPDPWQRLCLYRLKNSQTYPLINKSDTFTAKKKKKFSAFLLNPRCSQYRLSGVSSRLLCPLNQTKTDHLGLFLYMRDEATSGVGRDKMSEMLWLEFLVVLRFWRPMFHHCTPNTFPESAARTHTGAAGDFYLCGTANRPGPTEACGHCCLQCCEFLQNNAKF